MEPIDKLDAEELYHLALKASEKGAHDQAIIFLKESLALKPDANTQYILAAEHAEIGMLQRAVEEMAIAIDLAPELWTAHFQKGLLHMMLNQQEEAINTWEALNQLNEADALYHFGTGMACVLQGDNAQAIEHLEQGIARNQTNPALNSDMVRVLNKIKNPGESTGEAENTDNVQATKEHLFLAAYNKDDSERH